MTDIFSDPHVTCEPTSLGRHGMCSICRIAIPGIIAIRVRSDFDKKPMDVCLGCYAHRHYVYMQEAFSREVASCFPNLVAHWRDNQPKE